MSNLAPICAYLHRTGLSGIMGWGVMSISISKMKGGQLGLGVSMYICIYKV